MMDWKECINKKIVKNIKEDIDLIESLLKTSNNKLKSEEKLELNETTASSKISLAYDSLRELLEALAIKKGYKIYNHECYTAFLKEILNKTENAEEFDEIRKIKNNINYYGKEISIKEAEEVLARMRSLGKKILILLKTKD